jgi:hypothetical protein
MEFSAIIITAAVVSIIANIIKVLEFVVSRLSRRRKKMLSDTLYSGVLPAFKSRGSGVAFPLISSTFVRTS